jgi:hypothetical protein
MSTGLETVTSPVSGFTPVITVPGGILLFGSLDDTGIPGCNPVTSSSFITLLSPLGELLSVLSTAFLVTVSPGLGHSSFPDGGQTKKLVLPINSASIPITES